MLLLLVFCWVRVYTMWLQIPEHRSSVPVPSGIMVRMLPASSYRNACPAIVAGVHVLILCTVMGRAYVPHVTTLILAARCVWRVRRVQTVSVVKSAGDTFPTCHHPVAENAIQGTVNTTVNVTTSHLVSSHILVQMVGKPSVLTKWVCYPLGLEPVKRTAHWIQYDHGRWSVTNAKPTILPEIASLARTATRRIQKPDVS